MKTNKLLLTWAALSSVAFTTILRAQVGTFTNINAGLTSMSDSVVAWGDYDSDGRLDLLLVGTTTNGGLAPDASEIWHQNSNGTFSNVTATVAPGLPGVSSANVAWVDCNNDQRLDFLLSGRASSGATLIDAGDIWLGTGDGTFVPAGGPPGLPVVYPVSAWADTDGDGSLDFLISGQATNTVGPTAPWVTQYWRNAGFYFVRWPIPGMPVFVGLGPALAWGDYDNDGRLDLFIGADAEAQDGTFLGTVSHIWHNEGNGAFSNVTETAAAGLPGVSSRSSVAWGDYDNDGRLDFVLSYPTNGVSSQIWHNNGNGTFSNLTAILAPALTKVRYGTVAWGDYDNDGLLDLLLSGELAAGGYRVQVWRNTGSGFTNINAGITRAEHAAWGDYDHDGRLDIVITGASGTGPVSEIWRNTSPAANNPPTTPTGLQASVSGSVVTLSWNAATDDHTPSVSLSYNLRIGTSPGAWDVMAPMALPGGQLTVPQMGNVQLNVSRPFRANLGGTCYWSVQAVDGAFAGSPFASEQSFTVGATLAKAGDVNGDGTVDQTEFSQVVSNYWQSSPPNIDSVTSPSSTFFQFGLTNLDSLNFQVLATTNVALPLNQWQNIGAATLNYQFNDPAATNYPQRFYRLLWP